MQNTYTSLRAVAGIKHSGFESGDNHKPAQVVNGFVCTNKNNNASDECGGSRQQKKQWMKSKCTNRESRNKEMCSNVRGWSVLGGLQHFRDPHETSYGHYGSSLWRKLDDKGDKESCR